MVNCLFSAVFLGQLFPFRGVSLSIIFFQRCVKVNCFLSTVCISQLFIFRDFSSSVVSFHRCVLVNCFPSTVVLVSFFPSAVCLNQLSSTSQTDHHLETTCHNVTMNVNQSMSQLIQPSKLLGQLFPLSGLSRSVASFQWCFLVSCFLFEVCLCPLFPFSSVLRSAVL